MADERKRIGKALPKSEIVRTGASTSATVVEGLTRVAARQLRVDQNRRKREENERERERERECSECEL
jgi:hypothetical protein